MTDLINYWTFAKTLNIGPYPRDQELQFSLSDLDNEEWFDKLPPSEWRKESFTYKYNSHGFRSRPFDPTDKPILLTLGCSHTVGVGVPFEDTWSEQLGKQFPDHVVYNAGAGGASADTVARFAANIIPILIPAKVAILWPNLYRFESYCHGPNKNNTRYNGPWETDDLRFHFEDNNIHNNYTKNRLIVDLLQKIYNFQLLTMDMESINFKYRKTTFTKARDQQHYGSDWHVQISQDFYSIYQGIDIL